MKLKPYMPCLIATIATLPGLILRVAGIDLSPGLHGLGRREA